MWLWRIAWTALALGLCAFEARAQTKEPVIIDAYPAHMDPYELSGALYFVFDPGGD
jgi:hypothetical protein